MQLGPILYAMQRNKLRFGLIAAQIAVTLAIVANCVTLILDARRKMSRPPSFDDDNLIRIVLDTVDPALQDDKVRDEWHREVMARLRGIPGVRSVTNTWLVPWAANLIHRPLGPAGSSAVSIETAFLASDENFPDALGAEIDEGRWFTRDEVEETNERVRALKKQPRERASDGRVREPFIVNAVVTRAFGERVFGEGPLLGKILEDRDGDKFRIVGVVKRYYVPTREAPEEHAVFYPANMYSSWGTILIVRTEPGIAAAVLPMIEELLAYTGDFDPLSRRAHLVSNIRDRHFGPQQMTVALMGLLVVLLLLVASFGIAGLTSFSVTERTRQIGTRRALGATTADIVYYFLTESGLTTTVGLSLGAGLAVSLNMVLMRVYIAVKLGAGTVVMSALLLWVVALGAALPPALRGARTSPAVATRNV